MDGLDPLIHAPKRLRIMAILSTFDHVTFTLLQDRLGLAAPDLSKQLSALQQAKYVRTSKTGRGPGSQTWVTMTRSGLRAYDRHVAALRAVLDGTDSGDDADTQAQPQR
jgi:DNA-binding MarR family transcriptional regulator